uniref:WRKY transcription factor 81 n=1 Tax=Gossypium hirsutum TaxID=3635 RepID=A0A059Q7T7_GOSHI|nr:WRKY transcription factor 81 [Gossypium hirsutum]
MDSGGSSSSSFRKVRNPFVTDQELEESDNVSSVTGAESPPPSTTKKGKRSMQKRVVSVPIKDVEGSRLKGEGAPPSDSWAWRKYGQKPIKGSPYPRGYYRCSSSKGCPARKQVERSRVNPTMLVITYSCEHNHAWPASRHNNTSAKQAAAAAAGEVSESPTKSSTAVKHEPSTSQPDTEPDSGMEDGFACLTEDSILTTGDEFAWFGEMETTSSTVLESPLFSERDNSEADDTAMIFPMREEDESLFADLEELPECSFVFRHQRNVGPQVGIC